MAAWFFLSAKQYQNFYFDAQTARTVTMVIWAFAIGIVVASLLTFYQKYVPGALIRAILKAEAVDAATARSLAELGFAKNLFVRLELKRGTMLCKHLRFVIGAEQGTTEKKDPPTRCADIDNARFYIPEELKYRADARYDKKGNGPLQCILTAIISLAIALIIIRVLPMLLSFLDVIL